MFFPGPSPCSGRKLASATVESTLKQKLVLIETVILALRTIGLQDDCLMRVRLCLDEAITNAINHGNRHDPTRKVRAEVFASDTSWSVTITDEGAGFDPTAVPDPQQEAALLRESGRGVLLMLEFMDEVRFYDGGRCVWLSRKYGVHDASIENVPAFEIEELGATAIVLRPTVAGPIDELVCQHAEQELPAIATASVGKRVILDLGRASYVTDSGVGLLVMMQGRVREVGGEFALAAPSPLVRQIMQATNLDAVFSIFDSVDLAAAARS